MALDYCAQFWEYCGSTVSNFGYLTSRKIEKTGDSLEESNKKYKRFRKRLSGQDLGFGICLVYKRED